MVCVCVTKLCANERWCEMVCDKVEGGGGGGAAAEAGRDTESKTRTPHKDVGNEVVWIRNKKNTCGPMTD